MYKMYEIQMVIVVAKMWFDLLLAYQQCHSLLLMMDHLKYYLKSLMFQF